MLKLYTMPGACALAPNIGFAWLNVPVDIENMVFGEHREPAFLEINPAGKVPALQFDDGQVLTEAAAIFAWLGNTHGVDRFEQDPILRWREAEALSYMTSEVHTDYQPHFTVERYVMSEAAQTELKAKTYEKIAHHYDIMNKTLQGAGGEWYLGAPSFADAYLYLLVRWIVQTPLSLSDYPELKAHVRKMQADNGVRLALERQEMEPI
ncbi:glutathione S-transferase family protein [Roseobacter weihaiensis]|uniref:glutathione S-transferase family protein n=1 Tax=Roseobacter weihaiensis TaxID=2763262 RepID=UPI001D0A3D02|nr:glutathione S-transferase family protein [Roseobacter sp. H9]